MDSEECRKHNVGRATAGRRSQASRPGRQNLRYDIRPFGHGPYPRPSCWASAFGGSPAPRPRRSAAPKAMVRRPFPPGTQRMIRSFASAQQPQACSIRRSLHLSCTASCTGKPGHRCRCRASDPIVTSSPSEQREGIPMTRAFVQLPAEVDAGGSACTVEALKRCNHQTATAGSNLKTVRRPLRVRILGGSRLTAPVRGGRADMRRRYYKVSF
jgi:hypothetical protein